MSYSCPGCTGIYFVYDPITCDNICMGCGICQFENITCEISDYEMHKNYNGIKKVNYSRMKNLFNIMRRKQAIERNDIPGCIVDIIKNNIRGITCDEVCRVIKEKKLAVRHNKHLRQHVPQIISRITGKSLVIPSNVLDMIMKICYYILSLYDRFKENKRKCMDSNYLIMKACIMIEEKYKFDLSDVKNILPGLKKGGKAFLSNERVYNNIMDYKNDFPLSF